MDSTYRLGFTLKLILDTELCKMYGSFIRASRALLGLSQEEFAQLLGVTRSTLVRLENGVAPLKKNLCEAAVDLMKIAGITSLAMDRARHSLVVPSEIDISVNYVLLNSFLKLPRKTEVQSKEKALFGESFVAPLKEKPLRRK